MDEDAEAVLEVLATYSVEGILLSISFIGKKIRNSFFRFFGKNFVFLIKNSTFRILFLIHLEFCLINII